MAEPTPPLPVEVEGVDGVLACVVVSVGAAAWNGVDLKESTHRGHVEAHAHEHDAGEVVGLALLGAQPAVARTRAGAGDAELGGLEGRKQAGGGGIEAGSGDGVAVQVGKLQGGAGDGV